jgi:hypothetical protein
VAFTSSSIFARALARFRVPSKAGFKFAEAAFEYPRLLDYSTAPEEGRAGRDGIGRAASILGITGDLRLSDSIRPPLG